MRRFLPLASYMTMLMVLLGTLFKLMHWPSADEMVIAGLGSVIFLIPFYFIVRIKDTPNFFGKFAYFSLIFSSCVSVIGVLFKIMHWSGADEMCIFGIGTLIFPSLLFYTIFQAKKANNNFKESYYGFFGILLFCLLVVSIAYRNIYGVAETFDYSYRLMETNNIELMKSIDSTDGNNNSKELKTEILKTIHEIEELKSLVKKESKMSVSPYGVVEYRMNDKDVVFSVLRNNKGEQLLRKLSNINRKLQEISNKENKGLIFLHNRMDPKNRVHNQFGHHPASGILAKLTYFQNDLILSYKSLD